MSLRFTKLALVTTSLVGALTLARTAKADLIIEQPGAHPDYKIEVEPHLTFPLDFDGVGLGVRLSVPLVHNGFVKTINNNVAISFGLDWVHFDGCYRGWGWDRYRGWCGGNLNFFQVPVTLQWNFFLATHWSLYAELGLGYQRFSYTGDWDHWGYNPSRGRVHFMGFVGARYHFNESVALTLRLGEVSSLGVSFW